MVNKAHASLPKQPKPCRCCRLRIATGLIYCRLRNKCTKVQSALAREHLKSDDMLLIIEVQAALIYAQQAAQRAHASFLIAQGSHSSKHAYIMSEFRELSIDQIEGSVKQYMVENEGAIFDRWAVFP